MKARIGVNLLWLIPGQVGGSEEHILRLLRAASDVGFGDLKVRLYCNQSLLDTHSDLMERFETKVSPSNLSNRPLRIVAENTWLSNASKNDELLHHGGGVVPFVRSAVPIVTVHDLQPIEMPQNFSFVKRRWLKSMIPRSMMAARLIMCPSEFTSNQIQEFYGISSNRIRVISHGLVPNTDAKSDVGEVFDAKKLFGQYVLYPAITYKHKRHCDILSAVKEIENQLGDINVVFTGRPGPLTEALEKQAVDLEISDRVHQLGRVDISKLENLYKNALALVFPSEYEGFGNPIVEAMSFECPVICSDAGALAEVAKDAALMFKPRDVEAIANAILKVSTNHDFRSSLIKMGESRVKDFDWESSGKSLLHAYESALDVSGLQQKGSK